MDVLYNEFLSAAVTFSPPGMALLLLLLLAPSLATDPPSPDTYKVILQTNISEDPIVVEVTRSQAPLGADRFHALVKDGFYAASEAWEDHDSALFRVVPGFVLQFGISGNMEKNDAWLHSEIADDPVVGTNTRGTISFATAGPNTRTSQVFINYADNSRLDDMGFAPFGEVVGGMEVAEAVLNPTPGEQGGVDQSMYEYLGNPWVRAEYPGINFITAGYISE